MQKDYERVVFISDIHAPFEDKKALAILYNFIKWFKPDTVFIMGDLLDAYAISRFSKDPEGALHFQEELDRAIDILKDIRTISKKAKIYYIKGNHSGRIQKYLWNNAKELAGLHALELPNLLGLKRLNIEYVEKGMMMYKGVMVKHGSVVRKFAGYTAKAEFEKNGCSGVSAHSHRAAIYMQTNAGGDYKWMEVGCLCKLDQEYMEGETPNWQHSFGIGYFHKKTKRYQLELVNIIDKCAMYAGKEFRE